MLMLCALAFFVQFKAKIDSFSISFYQIFSADATRHTIFNLYLFCPWNMQKSSKRETLEISSTVLTAQLAQKQQNNTILLRFIALWIYIFKFYVTLTSQ